MIEPIPKIGGSLVFNSEGIAHCPHCNWVGMANSKGGRRVGKARYPVKTATSNFNGPVCYKIVGNEYDTYCLVCERDYLDAPTVKVGRNEPCPCGSGKKHKKCCGR